MEIKELLEKEEKLKLVRNKLKEDFVGIDDVIDNVISSIRSWYLFPELVKKPVIVCLWGLTGIGKTDLINKLIKYLGYFYKSSIVDMGQCSYTYDLEKKLENLNDDQSIIVFDEFQLGRTLTEDGVEDNKSFSRVIWTLIDSGVYRSFNWWTGRSLLDLIKRISRIVDEGTKIEKNKIVIESRNAKEILKMKVKRENKLSLLPSLDNTKDITNNDNDVESITESDIRNIADLMTDRTNIISPIDVQEKIESLNEKELLDYLIKIYRKYTGEVERDFSKSLIFILGNIDEAYGISRNFNADIDADSFYESSKKITIVDIKDALKSRFRPEQISRLGNNHIIYPSLSKKSFEEIIKRNIESLSTKIKETKGIELKFDKSINELIYNEGVYPTQGVRPVLSTIYDIITNKIAEVLCYSLEKFKLAPDEICISQSIDEENSSSIINMNILKEGESLDIYSSSYSLRLESLRKIRKDDLQAVTAVHESGHAIISMIMTNLAPSHIVSVTSDSNSNGFVVEDKPEDQAKTLEDILRSSCVGLAGLLSEELIFGERFMGGYSDLSRSTNLLVSAVRLYGYREYYSQSIPLGIITEEFIRDGNDLNYKHRESNTESSSFIKTLLGHCEETVKLILKSQKNLLIKLGDYLSDNKDMNSEKFIEYFEKYFDRESYNDILKSLKIKPKLNFDSINKPQYKYRDILKSLNIE